MPLLEVIHRLFRLKPIEKSVAQSNVSKTLSWYHLLAYGVSATVGSGIYVVVGLLAKDLTGPAVIFSVLASGLLALLTAFCYLELALQIPATGSGYVYAYSFIGEFPGFLVGWTSTLEYAFAGSVLSITLVDYFSELLEKFGVLIPIWLKAIPEDDTNYLMHINLLAFLVVFVVSFIVLKGVEFGTKFNTALTILNLSVLAFIITIGAFCIDVSNYTDFFPFGAMNLFHGAAQMMFCYIGFDTICNLTADAKRAVDLQIGVIGTVLTATVLYFLVGLVLTGMISYQYLDSNTSLASSFSQVQAMLGHTVNLSWVSHIVRFCALFMMFATLLACLIGQPRLFEMMAKDGFLPKIFYKESKNGIPRWNIILSCFLSGLVAMTIKKSDIVDITALGALLTFSINAYGLILSRLRLSKNAYQLGFPMLLTLFVGSFITSSILHFGGPELNILFWIGFILLQMMPFIGLCILFYKFSLALQPEFFKATGQSSLCPWMPLIPCLSIIGNGSVMPALGAKTFAQYGVWVAIGTILYLLYGYWNSKLHLDIMTGAVIAKEIEIGESTILKSAPSKKHF